MSQPALRTGQLGAGPREAVGGHGEQRGLMRCGQMSARSTRADRVADAELGPQRAGHVHDAELKSWPRSRSPAHSRLLCRHQRRCRAPVDAADQPLQGRPVELIGPAETVHHAGLSPLGSGFQTLGEAVVGDRRAVAILPLGDAQIHAAPIAGSTAPCNGRVAKLCAETFSSFFPPISRLKSSQINELT